MSNGTPTAYLLWAILSCIVSPHIHHYHYRMANPRFQQFLAFLVVHLWAYDRFNCLKWDSGRQPGAFKRVMTYVLSLLPTACCILTAACGSIRYSYLATVPLLVVFSVATTALKFKEGVY